MLSSVLRSRRAIAVNVQIMRAFIQMRGLLASNRQLAVELSKLERRVAGRDADIERIVATIRNLMKPPVSTSRPIGFFRLEEKK